LNNTLHSSPEVLTTHHLTFFVPQPMSKPKNRIQRIKRHILLIHRNSLIAPRQIKRQFTFGPAPLNTKHHIQKRIRARRKVHHHRPSLRRYFGNSSRTVEVHVHDRRYGGEDGCLTSLLGAVVFQRAGVEVTLESAGARFVRCCESQESEV
jgi:hypothetical protein